MARRRQKLSRKSLGTSLALVYVGSLQITTTMFWGATLKFLSLHLRIGKHHILSLDMDALR